MSGIEGLTQSWKSTKLWYCQPSYMHVRPRQCTNAMPTNLTIATYPAWESSWRSDGKTRSRIQKSWREQGCKGLKLVQLRWTGHVTRMPDERRPKKVFYEELKVGTLENSNISLSKTKTEKVNLTSERRTSLRAVSSMPWGGSRLKVKLIIIPSVITTFILMGDKMICRICIPNMNTILYTLTVCKLWT